MSSHEPLEAEQASLLRDSGRRNGSSFHSASGQSKDKLLVAAGPKSLFFCLCLDNPFDDEVPETRIVDEALFVGEHEGVDTPPTGMSDDELLMAPPAKSGFSKQGSDAAPNKFQKVMEIILRLQTRGVEFLPHNMMRQATSGPGMSPNYYHGFELVKENLLASPDGDEMYIKLHATRELLLKFAESHGLNLNTHPFSYGGGAPMPFSAETELKLQKSVELFAEAYPEEFDDEGDGGVTAAGKKKKVKREGFLLDVPDKMRLFVRQIREAWKYGGCGIQIAEMKKKNILVRHFFPMHNPAYQRAYSLDKWGSFRQMFTRDPLYQVESHVVKYFGEEIALYFSWIREYTLFLRYIAGFGLIAAVLGYAGRYDSDAHQYFPISLVNGIFSAICVVWGFAWNFRWGQYESTFATDYGQEAQMQQELVRDQFETEKELDITVPDIYRCRFDYPLTLRNKSDGSMVDLHSSHTRRVLIRYGVSYPVIFLLSAGMLVALIFTTKWRFTYPDDDLVSYGSSVATVLIGFVFGTVFEYIVPTLNAWENNRTDSEENAQTVSKSFLFYFLSYYFALFTIILWPSDASGTTDNSRLDQLASQMLIITLVKPMVQNAQELVLPWLNAELRRRGDIYKSKVRAICSLLCCRSMKDMEEAPRNALEEEGRQLWQEAQMEPYESTSGDYLEITLQFGYMTMFAATFPLATVAAFLYNIMEIRVDARKLISECQRSIAAPATTIGPWNGILYFLSVMSIVTNSYLTCVVSPFPKQLSFTLDTATRYRVFTVFQYILVIGFFGMHLWFGGPSYSSCKTKAKHHILHNKGTRLRFEKTMRQAAVSRHAIEATVGERSDAARASTQV